MLYVYLWWFFMCLYIHTHTHIYIYIYTPTQRSWYTTCRTCRSCHAISWNITRKRLTWPQAIHRLSHSVTRHRWISAAMPRTSAASCIPRIRTRVSSCQLWVTGTEVVQSVWPYWPLDLLWSYTLSIFSHVVPFYLCSHFCSKISLLESFKDSTLPVDARLLSKNLSAKFAQLLERAFFFPQRRAKSQVQNRSK